MGPGRLGSLVDQGAPDSFEEVLALHEVLADAVVLDEAVLSSLVLRLFDGAVGHLNRQWTLSFNGLSHLCVEGIFILLQLGEYLFQALTVKDVANVVLVFDDPVRWRLIIALQDFLDGLFGLHTAGQLRFEVIVNCWDAGSWNEVISYSRLIYILSLQSSSCQAQIVADVVAQSRQEIPTAYIGEEPNLGLWHSKQGVFGGYSKGREDAEPNSASHDNPIPVRDLQ